MQYTMDEMRDKIHGSGWTIRELPIRSGDSSIRSWKMIAIKGDRSITLEGKTLENALKSTCEMLGLIKR